MAFLARVSLWGYHLRLLDESGEKHGGLALAGVLRPLCLFSGSPSFGEEPGAW